MENTMDVKTIKG